MFFGASLWPTQWHPPYNDGIRRVARLGLQGVELIAWRPEVLVDYYTPTRVQELRQLIADEGLVLTAFWHNAQKIGSANPGEREEALDNIRRCIDIASGLGALCVGGTAPYPFGLVVPRLLDRPTLQEWVAPVERDLDWTKNYDDYVAAIATVCAAAKQADLTYVIEPHPYSWVNSAQSMLRLIERTGAENLGLNLDPSHLFPSGEIPHYTVYQVGRRVRHTHFSDNDGQSNAHWRPGKGKIDWAALLRALDDVGYTGPISLELEGVPGAAKRDREATPALDRELTKAISYLTQICDEEGITTRR